MAGLRNPTMGPPRSSRNIRGSFTRNLPVASGANPTADARISLARSIRVQDAHEQTTTTPEGEQVMAVIPNLGVKPEEPIASTAPVSTPPIDTETDVQPVIDNESAPGSETPVEEVSTATTPTESENVSKETRRAPGAEKRIKELTAKNRESESKRLESEKQVAHLQALLSSTGATAPVSNAAPVAPVQAKPEETEAYWANVHSQALSEEQRLYAAGKWNEIHSKNERQATKAEIVSELRSELQKQQQQATFARELAKVNDRVPFLTEDGQIDTDAPVVREAIALATAHNVPLMVNGQYNTPALTYFMTSAALNLLGSTTATTAAQLAEQKLQTRRAVSKTNLETPSTSEAPQPQGRIAAMEKALVDAEARQKKGPFDRSLNAGILKLRMDIREARLRKGK